MARFAGPVGVAAAGLVLAFGVGSWAALLLVLTALLLSVVHRRKPVVRARKRRVWTDEERRFILDRDGWQCVYCGATDQLEIDHIVPFSRGGACSIENSMVLCRSCNASKGAS